MKKVVAVGIALGMVVGSLAAPAMAAKKKKKKKPAAVKPVATTLYAHGPNAAGEVDGALWFPTLGGPSPFTLDATKPDGAAAKSMTFTNPALNDQCTGLPTAHPVFVGPLVGTIKGNVKLTGYFAAAPSNDVIARIWVDTPVFSCNDAYIPPAKEVKFDVPAGQSEIPVTFSGLNVTAQSTVMIQFLTGDVDNGYAGQAGRLLYDATSALTRIEFPCIPAKGKKACV